MGKYISVVGGVIAILLGILGIFGWWGHLIAVIQGILPILLIFGGCIALFLGISEVKDEIAAKK